ncbi:MAG: tetratricopeptide repeat protein [bacterium]|nr:tetratricopeptide repeat protein [bacterium]
MAGNPYISGVQGLAPIKGPGAVASLNVFLIQAGLEGHLDNPVEVIRRAMQEKFSFNVVTEDQFEKDLKFRTKLFGKIRDSIFVVVVLDGLTPSLAFQYGLAVAINKPIITLKSQNANVDVRSLYSEKERADEKVKEAPQPKLNYLAHLPGLVDEQVIVFQPGDAEGLITRLIREIVLNRQRIATEILRTGSDVPLNLYLQFLSYLDGDERKRILGEAMERFPTDKNLFIMAGRIKLMENDLVGAVLDFEKAVELNPNDPTAHMQKAEIYYELGQFETAIEDYDKAIQLQPVNPNAYYNKGNALFYMDEEDVAAQHFEVAVDQNPDFANALNNQASIQIN